MLYRVSKKKLMPFIFKLAANFLLEFVCSHVYSQHGVVNDCKSTVPFKSLQLKLIFNSHMGLDLCFKLMVHLFDMLRLLMRYLGNFCQIATVMGLI